MGFITHKLVITHTVNRHWNPRVWGARGGQNMLIPY